MLSSVANSTYGGHLLYVEFDRLALNNQNMDSLLLLHIKYWSISPAFNSLLVASMIPIPILVVRCCIVNHFKRFEPEIWKA